MSRKWGANTNHRHAMLRREILRAAIVSHGNSLKQRVGELIPAVEDGLPWCDWMKRGSSPRHTADGPSSGATSPSVVPCEGARR